MSKRILRINDEILREIAEILRTEMNDPRISSMTTVTKVDTTNDLKFAKVYVSIFSDNKEEVMDGIVNASGYIRKLIAKNINLRNTPMLTFILDDSLDNVFRMNKLIDEANKPKKSVSDETIF